MVKDLVLAEFRDVDPELAHNVPIDVALRKCLEVKNGALARGDLDAAGHAAKAAAECYRRLGALDKAINEQQAAFVMFEQTGNKSGLTWTKWSNGILLRQECEFALAIPVLQTAYIDALNIRDYRCAAYSLAGMAETTRIQGTYRTSIVQHLKALEIFRAIEDYRGIVWAYGGLAQMYKNVGQLRTAFRIFDTSLTIAKETGDMVGLGYALRGLGELHYLGGAITKGIDNLYDALSVFRAKRLPLGEAYVHKSLGEIYLRQGYVERSIHSFHASLNLFRDLNDQRGIAFALKGIGDILKRLSFFDEAIDVYRECYTFFKAKGISFGSGTTGVALARLGLMENRSWTKSQGSSFFENPMPISIIMDCSIHQRLQPFLVNPRSDWRPLQIRI